MNTAPTLPALLILLLFGAVREPVPVLPPVDPDPAYTQVIQGRAQKIVDTLAIDDKAKALQDRLHTQYLLKLSALLTPAQVDQVKDGMTYGVAQVTYNSYLDMLPQLAEEQKAALMAYLVEGNLAVTQDNWAGGVQADEEDGYDTAQILPQIKQDEPYPHAYIEIQFAQNAYETVLAQAEEAGVVIGIETALDAAGDVRILEDVSSPAIRIYFNFASALKNGRDLCKELRVLGKDHICQIHSTDTNGVWLENNTRLDMPEVEQTLDDMDWSGWLVIERSRDASSTKKLSQN